MLLLEKENIKAEQQTPIKVFYKDKIVGKYFSDILVNDEIILELKTVKNISKKHKAQMINYLNATKKKLGLIINFGSEKLEFKRILNKKELENK